MTLEAVPNVSAGGDGALIRQLGEAFGGAGARLLDVHTDPDHDRSVFTLVGTAGELVAAVAAGGRLACERIDLRANRGGHPHIGALDVAPVVFLAPADRDAARAAALRLAERLAAVCEVPVFLYGELASAPERRERAFFRRGGPEELARRMAAGELRPDYGPPAPHPTAGATLVAARPPLVAFNVELESDDLELARAISAAVREAGGGLPGVRAMGVMLEAEGRAQVSTNVGDPFAVPLRDLVAAIRREAEARGARLHCAELVGLAPRAALEGFPEDLHFRGPPVEGRILEERVAASG